MSLKVASKAKRKRKISNTPIPIICKSMRSCRQLIPCSYYELSRLHCVGDCIRRAIEICPHLNCTHLNQVNTGIFPFCKSDYLSELQFAQRMSFYTSLHREAMDAAVTLEDQDPHCSWPPKFQREFVKFSDRFRGIVHQYCLYYRKIMYLEWSLQHGLRRNFISMIEKKRQCPGTLLVDIGSRCGPFDAAHALPLLVSGFIYRMQDGGLVKAWLATPPRDLLPVRVITCITKEMDKFNKFMDIECYNKS